jgi:hypothetical protein
MRINVGTRTAGRTMEMMRGPRLATNEPGPEGAEGGRVENLTLRARDASGLHITTWTFWEEVAVAPVRVQEAVAVAQVRVGR